MVGTILAKVLFPPVPGASWTESTCRASNKLSTSDLIRKMSLVLKWQIYFCSSYVALLHDSLVYYGI